MCVCGIDVWCVCIQREILSVLFCSFPHSSLRQSLSLSLELGYEEDLGSLLSLALSARAIDVCVGTPGFIGECWELELHQNMVLIC